MRTRLGSAQKSPIEKLSIGTTNNIVCISGIIFALLFIHFGGNVLIRVINFISHESESGFIVDPNEQTTYIIKGVIALITTFLMLKK